VAQHAVGAEQAACLPECRQGCNYAAPAAPQGSSEKATVAAVAALLKIMVDPGAPASTRVRAADSVLDHPKQAIEIEDVEIRVAALEQAALLSNHDEPET
jgi:hypothetical protein